MNRTTAYRPRHVQQRRKKTAGRRATHGGQRDQSLLRLVICGAIFVFLVALKLLLPGAVNTLAQSAEELLGRDAELFRACARILDLHAKGVSKLRSARDLQKYLGKKILVCVGDAENDLTMLEGADYAFCPSDGIVAERFPNVCPCDEGAVADVIYEKIPEILKMQK